MNKSPFISIIIPTYNRRVTLKRALESVLKQTFSNFEIIVIDDGSTDDTAEFLRELTDERIRVIKHEKNKGVTAAKNTGLNNIRGEWFCTLDSDNELMPEALEEMLSVPLEKDPRVNGVVCNCVDSVSGNFTGFNLYKDQYLDLETRMNAEGEFWGILKTSLLGRDRFNTNLPGYENTLWYKIYERAFRYYIHKGYQIYHTEGDDRITVNTKSIETWDTVYSNLIKEDAYLGILKKYRLREYAKRCLLGTLFCKANNNITAKSFWSEELTKLEGFTGHKIQGKLLNVIPGFVLKYMYNFFRTLVKAC